LAWGITKVLTDDGFSRQIMENAYRKILEKYDWDKIAKQTRRMYEAV
jgi:glycosyltransferase involved in cell wall biosynthesis